MVQNYTLTQGAEPLRVGLGTRFNGKRASLAWELGISGVWTQWSQYRDRHGERPLDTWHDTVTVGLGWALERSHRRFLAELGVAPSPVPKQVGRTNYVDNTRLAASSGIEVPVSINHADYAAGLYVQGQFMLPQSVTKRSDAAHPVLDEVPDAAVDLVHGQPLPGASGLQTNNPGYPGYTSCGTILGVALVLKALR